MAEAGPRRGGGDRSRRRAFQPIRTRRRRTGSPAGTSLPLLDFTGRLGTGPHAIQGDLTRVYFLGERVPDEIQRVAPSVFQARDAALDLLRQRWPARRAR